MNAKPVLKYYNGFQNQVAMISGTASSQQWESRNGNCNYVSLENYILYEKEKFRGWEGKNAI